MKEITEATADRLRNKPKVWTEFDSERGALLCVRGWHWVDDGGKPRKASLVIKHKLAKWEINDLIKFLAPLLP